MITVTGATGFLGAHLLAALLRRDDRPVCALVRDDPATARERLSRAVRSTGARWEEAEFQRRVTPVKIDLPAPRLGLSAEDHHALARQTQELWHCAADTSPLGPVAALHRSNVEGTGRVLELLDAGARETRLFHISTAFVAGERREGIVLEDTLDERYGFATLYEESKYRAEVLVRDWSQEKGRPAVVFRPSLLVTDRSARTGEPRHWLAVQAARTSLLGRQGPALVLRASGVPAEDVTFPYRARVPGRPDAVVNLLQVDWAVAAMLRCAAREPDEAGGVGGAKGVNSPSGPSSHSSHSSHSSQGDPSGLDRTNGLLVTTYHVSHPQDSSVPWLMQIALESCDWLDVELDPELTPERMSPLDRSLMRLAAGLDPYWWSRRGYDRSGLEAATAGLEPPAELSAQYVRSGMTASSSSAGSASAGTSPDGTSPPGTSPDSTSPASTSPAGTSSAGSAPKGAVTAHV
ncbi:SDR family oxidoreductase [Streptomyces inhibens]|uniref:SDR family oxidoreductase n=1 Tax=Streptomyces inhibens TaxID=2293571 RepID=UPI001EE6E9B5|nr:SDR family oxidoreductase [Streptomyces inhibens]UKY47712.1 SDR family oxidoreductase [Streptomyces inhibens]